MESAVLRSRGIVVVPMAMMVVCCAALWHQPPHLNCSVSLDHSSLRANCSHLSLRSVPESLPHNLQELDLSYNSISALGNSSFARYVSIRILNLHHNALTLMEADTFSPLGDLTELDFSSNNIRYLPTSTFKENSHLSSLDLSHNRLNEIPNNAFGSIMELRYINLSHNLISKLSFHGFSSGRFLSKIDLTKNKLSRLQKENFQGLENVVVDYLILGLNTALNLSKNVFSHIHNVKNIQLDHINLMNLDMHVFLGNCSITKVWLSHANIHTISPLKRKYSVFPELVQLELSYNRLSKIPIDGFWGFQRLTHLHLQSNRLVSITNSSLCGLDSLTYLDLQMNKLSNLPPGLFSCVSELRTLLLSKNDIAFLDSVPFQRLPLLQSLDLSLNNIAYMQGPWDLSLLESINLQSNRLLTLDEKMLAGLGSLHDIDISGNQIYTLAPNTFVGLTSLESINLSYQVYLTLNGTFAQMKHLTQLNVGYTTLYTTSLNQFSNTSSLRNLSMSKTKLTMTDLVSGETNSSLFTGLVSLEFLNLHGNNLVQLHKFSWVFLPLVKLEVLDINNCQIAVLSPGIFSHLSTLQSLILHNNNIQEMHPQSFQDMGSLKVLLLQVNQIGFIDRDLFIGTPNLTKLYLQTNQITTVAPNTYMPKTLIRLDISHNPLTCTCQLSWFRTWLQNSNINSSPNNQTLCSVESFKQLVGQPLDNFHPEDLCGINTFLVSGVAVATVFLLLLGILIYKKRWWLNYKMFLIKLCILGYTQQDVENLPTDEYKYQLNIMFPDDNTEWVDEVMRPALGERMPHLDRVAYGDDAFNLTMFYIDAIHEVIEKSYKTVLLLSDQCLEDAWFITKVRAALEHVNETRLDKVVLVFLEDIPDERLPYLVRLFLSRDRPNLLWTEDEDGQDLFWAQFEKTMRTNKAINHVLPI